MSVTRTSLSHPLQIATLPVGHCGGAIGVTFAPGKHQDIAMTGSWSRDLDIDLQAISSWGASHLISLIEPWEFEDLQISALPERAVAHGLRWYGLPIRDGAAPDCGFLQTWKELEKSICNDLLDGERVVVHCKGGLGRAGTVACMLLLATKTSLSSEDAIRRVRQVRHGAVETSQQERFIHNWGSLSHTR
ncbi:cyclin-dependent kinase inhibitor 3 family protein [Xanthomonas sp. NCPPB 3443]|uniref:cyclin-dependent kinase inhibitor 3 family protein n=1 Tax=Xanthomonas sp. NCPPB 3443 TaxID=3243407 RepID=UPI003555F059